MTPPTIAPTGTAFPDASADWVTTGVIVLPAVGVDVATLVDTTTLVRAPPLEEVVSYRVYVVDTLSHRMAVYDCHGLSA